MQHFQGIIWNKAVSTLNMQSTTISLLSWSMGNNLARPDVAENVTKPFSFQHKVQSDNDHCSTTGQAILCNHIIVGLVSVKTRGEETAASLAAN